MKAKFSRFKILWEEKNIHPTLRMRHIRVLSLKMGKGSLGVGRQCEVIMMRERWYGKGKRGKGVRGKGVRGKGVRGKD